MCICVCFQLRSTFSIVVDTEIAESQSKPETSKTKMRAKKMETDSLEEPKDSNDDVSMD